jgi:hypothetical protein
MSTFVDILSKREHFYRSYINSFNLVANLPNHLTKTPSNTKRSESTRQNSSHGMSSRMPSSA